MKLTEGIKLLNGLLIEQISHEVTSSLPGIISTLNYFLSKPPVAIKEKTEFQDVITKLQELAGLKKELIFSQKPEYTPFALNPLVKRECKVGGEYGKERRITLKDNLDERLKEGGGHDVIGVPAYVRLILRNLLVNAVEASEPGGIIAVITAWEPSKDERNIILRVSDEGKGISLDDRHRIFDPYFSTKEGGFGIGLAVVMGLTERLDARLELPPTHGRGTTFTLKLKENVTR